MKRKQPICPPVPPRVRSLIGMRFGRLLVKYFAGQDKHRKAKWCCLCDCGVSCMVPSSRLLGQVGRDRGHGQKSCGCMRSDPGVRKAARANVPKERRIEICNKMRAARKRSPRPYALSAMDAAERLDCSVEQVEVMVHDGLLRGKPKAGGDVYVSRVDVERLYKTQHRNQRHCRAVEDYDLNARAMEAAHKPSKRKTAKA